MFERPIRFLGRHGAKHLSSHMKSLKDVIIQSNLTILFEIYLGRMLFTSIMFFVSIFIFITVVFTIFGIPLFMSIASALIAAVTSTFFVLTINYSYPFHIITSKRNSIEANSPFVINHMAAIAASGVPPFVIFKLISNIPEYEEVSNECKRIVRNVDTFGMDIVSAVKNVIDRTPSDNFRLRRERYMQALSTYADLYTAVLIAAPLFFVSILSILSLVGGHIFGLPIDVALRLGIYTLIPLLNIFFLAFFY